MSRTVSISPLMRQEMLDHACEGFPEEICGLLVGTCEGNRVIVAEVVRAVNITDGDPRTSFQVDWDTLLRTTKGVRGTGSEVVGCYHSHPSGPGEPSDRDRRDAWSGHVMFIISDPLGPGFSLTCWVADRVGARLEACDIVIGDA